MNQVFVSLDIEMTTPKAENQEILEIAAIKFRGQKVLDSWSTLVNPHCEIPYNIHILTGISQADVDRAPAFSDVAGDLVAFIGDAPIIAHSVASDISCLERKGVHFDNVQIDTYELASILLPRLNNYGLAALAEHFNISSRAQHRAAADALVTKQLFLILMEKATELDLSIVQEINRMTAFIDWPIAGLFKEAEKRKAREVFDGTSIRSRIATKGGLENAALDVMFAGRPGRDNLVPKDEVEPVDITTLTQFLDAEGAIAQGFSGYEHRPEQVGMMRAVAEALNEGKTLVVEAGTGVGKSVAYLAPAIGFSVLNNQHVVISTNTINLQDQLFNKDLPDLQKMLPWDFRAALVKGRANYLCQRRWVALRRRHDLTRQELLTLVKILVWLPTTSTGDVGELNLSEEQRPVWGKLCAQAETCLGNQCAYFRKGSCFLFRARQTAASSHVIVVNHSLLFSDLVSSNHILPEYRYLIVDEAHHFEDEATQQLGFKVGDRNLYGYLDGLSQPIGGDRRLGILSEIRTRLQEGSVPKGRLVEADDTVKELHEKVDGVREQIAEFLSTLSRFVNQQKKEQRGYDARLRLTEAMRVQPDWSSVDIAWDSVASDLQQLEEGVSRLLVLLGQLEEFPIPEYEAMLAELSSSLFQSQEFRSQVGAAIGNPEADKVYWVATGAGSGAVSICAAPLHVGPTLDKTLFSAKNAVVLTSATLSTGGNFEYVKERLGIAEAEGVLLGSPFEYGSAAMLYVPNDIVEPDRPDYQRQLQATITSLVTATEGRALVLFTSHSQLRQTYQAIKEPLREQGILAVAHGVDGSARQLLQTFKTNPKTILLGTSSFWEGVDVVGDALSVLIIARLPFAVPTDPIVAARSELFQDPFSQYSVPQSILKFKQGFGRLIRSKRDRGVVVVMDRRILTRSYGRVFLRSLPPCTFRQGPARILPGVTMDWLRRKPSGSGSPVERQAQRQR